MGLFNRRKRASLGTPLAQELIATFTNRAARLGLAVTEADVQQALQQAQVQAAQDDKIYRLPDQYGDLLMAGAVKGDEDCQAFVARALQGGANEEDLRQWWNLPDLTRRMYEWEHEIILHDFYQELLQKDLSESEVMMNLFRMLPFYGDPEDESTFAGDSRPLPEELRLRVFAWAEQTTGELHPAALREEAIPYPSMNAYLRAQLNRDPWTEARDAILHLYQQQQYGPALQRAEQLNEALAEALDEAHPTRRQVMYDLLPVFMAGGRYDINIPWLEKFVSETDPNDEGSPILLNNLGQQYTEMGRFQDAADCFQAGLKALQANPTRANQDFLWVRIMHNLALALARAMQFAEAAPLYEQALAFMQGQTGERAGELRLTMQANLSLTYLGLQRLDDALALQESVLQARQQRLGPQHPHVANSLDSLGNIWLQKGDHAQSLPYLERAAQIRRASLGPQHPDYTLSLSNLTLAYSYLGQWEQAAASITTAVHNVLDQIRHQYLFLPEAEQQAFFKILNEVLEFFQALTARLHPKYPEMLPLLFEIQLQSRGLQIRGLQQLKQQLLAADDEQLQAQFEAWMQHKARLAESYAQPEAREQRKQWEQAAQDLEERLRAQLPAFAEGLREVPDWSQLKAALQPGEVLVECFSFTSLASLLQGPAEQQYGALLIAPDQPQPVFVAFPPAEQSESSYLRQYLGFVREKQGEASRSLNWEAGPTDEGSEADQLFDTWWAPLAPHLEQAHKLYFLPDGIFYQINPETLWHPAQGAYVGETLDVQLLNHAADLLRTPLPVSRQPAVLMGDPDFGPSVSYLPGTRQEVEQIQGLLTEAGWTTRVYLGTEAQSERLRQVDHPALLHVATHGFFEAEPSAGQTLGGFDQEVAQRNPYLRSGLLFTGAGAPPLPSGPNPGIFTAYEAANLNLLRTALVVLSACNTGSGEVQGGEGVYGLSRAFREAGAQAVMHSLWPVSDEVTAEFMALFYQYWLADGELRRAFLRARDEVKQRHPEPYYWGAFQLV